MASVTAPISDDEARWEPRGAELAGVEGVSNPSAVRRVAWNGMLASEDGVSLPFAISLRGFFTLTWLTKRPMTKNYRERPG